MVLQSFLHFVPFCRDVVYNQSMSGFDHFLRIYRDMRGTSYNLYLQSYDMAPSWGRWESSGFGVPESTTATWFLGHHPLPDQGADLFLLMAVSFQQILLQWEACWFWSCSRIHKKWLNIACTDLSCETPREHYKYANQITIYSHSHKHLGHVGTSMQHCPALAIK